MNGYYRSFDDEMKELFGGKVYKLSLSAAHTCPNRDGSCGTGGCIFCSAEGSGDFAENAASIDEQIERAKLRVSNKLGRSFAGYMAYFQAFTETYGDTDYLAGCFEQAAAHSEILALSIATRPDSISDDMIARLQAINEQKPVYIELGLQTVHADTARYINRCYELPVFEDAFRRLKCAGLRVVVHVIIGLPNENEEKTAATVKYLAKLTYRGMHIDGIKLQLLHVLKDTELEKRMPCQNDMSGTLTLKDGAFLECYSMSDYAGLIVKLVAMLPKDITVHRITGDPPKSLLIWPQWTTDKKRVLNTIARAFREEEKNKFVMR